MSNVRWWPFATAAAVLAVVVWAFATEWTGITGSHRAYLVTLVMVVIAATATIAWAILSGPPRHTGARRWSARAALVVGGIALMVALVFLRPMSADSLAIDALDDGSGVTVEISGSMIRLTPETGTRATGLAFYPGALVDPRAYARVLRPIAEAGFPVVIFKPPYNLAILRSDAADDVVGDPDDAVTTWVVGGHSLGGAMAARYAERARDELAGLLLYAAYPVNDMSDHNDLAVLSVFGTNDAIATPEEIDESAAELPPATEFAPIDGAIHAYFGDYGAQRGDGTASVDRAEAQRAIADVTIGFLDEVDMNA